MMTNQLLKFLSDKGIIANPENITRIIIEQLEQKEITITNLSQQITKYKCENLKQQKLIKSLQDKITQLSPSNSNTSSTFMMASEFKNNFQELMTTTLPLALGEFVDRPHLFSKCASDLFVTTYNLIESRLSQIICSIKLLLNIQTEKGKSIEVDNKIKLSLIKILQEHWEEIVPIMNPLFHYEDPMKKMQQKILRQLNQVLESDDYKDLYKQLHKIVVYMVFQQKQWQFVGLNKHQIKDYIKKQYTCLDGWVKDGQKCLEVLEGIKKDGHMHANLKNYVIPYQQDEFYKPYECLKFQLTSYINKDKIDTQVDSSQNQSDDRCMRLNETQNMPTRILQERQKQNSCLMKNKSTQFLKNDKQNNPNYFNKKLYKKQKNTKANYSIQSNINEPKLLKIKKSIESSINKNPMGQQIIYNKTIENTISTKNNIQIHSFLQDISMPLLKKKVIEELPVSKDIQIKKKNKAVSSRKTSVGKIVHQNGGHSKEITQFHLASKIKKKEKTYKDIIKQKLLFDDKDLNKIPLSLGMYQKSKTDRRKEENRPLKMQGNASKLRQKYIN